MRILVTGYEPFDERGYNTSSDVLQALPEHIDGVQLVTGTLPVVWRRAQAAIEALLDRYQPDIAVALGMSRDAHLGLERIAANFQTDVRPDNDGQLPPAERIEPDGPPAYFSTLDLDSGHAALKAGGFPSVISGWAGGYLCNFAFYRLAHRQAQATGLRRAGFVHVPPRPSDGGWPLERLSAGLECFIATVAD